MNEENEYYKRSGTSASSIVLDHESLIAIPTGTNLIESNANPTLVDALINQDIIKTHDYRRNKASRKVIAHVPFKPD